MLPWTVCITDFLAASFVRITKGSQMNFYKKRNSLHVI